MPLEIINYLKDVSQHLHVLRRRKALREPGKGVDYTAEKYTDVVERVVTSIHPKRMRLRVTNIRRETASTKTFRLERTDGRLPPFRPGQYVNAFVDVDGILTSRPYSISSPPRCDAYELTVRDNPGGFVAPYFLHEVQVGDELETSGPDGSFYHEPLIDGDDLIFLAGGSGITPFMSIIREALQQDLPLKMQLLYGSRSSDDVIFGEELAELAAERANLDYKLVISEPPPDYDGLTGFLDAEFIKSQVGPIPGKTFYICGPGEMYDFCLVALVELGVPAHRIRRELYGPPADVTKEPGWPRELSADAVFNVEVIEKQMIRARAGEPLMNTLERYGIVVPAICRTGACSACRTRLLSGQVYMPAQTGLRESDREYGYIHACVAYPLEDLRIRL